MELTQKQEKFCLEYFKSGNAASAYRKSYNASKMVESSISKAVNQLLKNTKITTRLQELNSKIESKTIMDKQNLLEFWTKTVQNKTSKDSDKLKASELLAKYYQMFVEKKEVEHNVEVKKLEEWFVCVQPTIDIVKNKLAKLQAESKPFTE